MVMYSKSLVGVSIVSAMCLMLSQAANASAPPLQGAPPTAPLAQVPTPSPTPAPQASDTAKPLTQTAQLAGPELVCRSQVNLGSRLGKRRVCRTAAEWEELRRVSQRALDDRTRNNQAGRSKGDGG